MITDNIRVSKKAKDQLIQLKRKTGIKTWNVLCRWALLRSLAEPAAPPEHMITLDSNLEMTWKTFAGAHAPLFDALIKQRLLGDDIPITADNLTRHFILHLHRGIAYATGSADLLRFVAHAPPS